MALVAAALAAEGQMAELRALGSLFTEPIQVVVKADSPLTSIADLKGKRVDLASAGPDLVE